MCDRFMSPYSAKGASTEAGMPKSSRRRDGPENMVPNEETRWLQPMITLPHPHGNLASDLTASWGPGISVFKEVALTKSCQKRDTGPVWPDFLISH